MRHSHTRQRIGLNELDFISTGKCKDLDMPQMLSSDNNLTTLTNGNAAISYLSPSCRQQLPYNTYIYCYVFMTNHAPFDIADSSFFTINIWFKPISPMLFNRLTLIIKITIIVSFATVLICFSNCALTFGY